MRIVIKQAQNGWVVTDASGPFASQTSSVFTDARALRVYLDRVLALPPEGEPEAATNTDFYRAWFQVCKALHEVRPEWLREGASAIGAATNTIRRLAAQADGQSSDAAGEQAEVREVDARHLTDDELKALIFICRAPTTIARIMATTDGPSQEDMANALKKAGAAATEAFAKDGITV